MAQRLRDKRVLVTQAEDFMGPITVQVFREHGAEVVADGRDLTSVDAAQRLIEDCGRIDVLVANLAAPAKAGTATVSVDEDHWQRVFDVMVHPLHRLTRAVLPQMIERRTGKIVVYGSATGVKGMEGVAAYSSARSAQVGYVRSVGIEVARHNVQVNLIAQNYVENEEYYPRKVQENPKFQEHLRTCVPAGRLATATEDALFALFLASDESDFFVGQAIPFSGGWAV
jgi:NAD(P)-dependent dehydrogenase (short-subunit alcohol dehydrogenase family)